MIKAQTREHWSRPIQASIVVPMDIFKVERDDGPNIQIRLEGDKVYLNVMAYDHVSYLKSITIDYKEFVRIVGESFFDMSWATNSRAFKC